MDILLRGLRELAVEPLLGDFTAPLILPAVDGLDTFAAGTEGGAIDSLLVLFPEPGGLGAFEGVVVREVDRDELFEPSCLVGDVPEDYSGQTKWTFLYKTQDVPPTLSSRVPCP